MDGSSISLSIYLWFMDQDVLAGILNQVEKRWRETVSGREEAMKIGYPYEENCTHQWWIPIPPALNQAPPTIPPED